MVTIQKAAPCSKGSVASITLENANGMRVTLLSYGATIQSILVPDKDGRMTDVLLGYDRAADYEVNSGYLGACIGRNGNRIAGAAFCLNGRRYTLTANEDKNQLHGGLCGFDKKIWSYTCREDSVEFTTVLADGEEGFPGRMEVAITFTLDDENGLHIDYRAVSDRDTVANFTNHAYFNLNGHGSGDILGHTLQLPRHDVAVVLHYRDNHLVALGHEGLAERRRYKIDALCCATCEDYLLYLWSIDKLAHFLASRLVQVGGTLRQIVYATVNVGVGIEIFVAHCVEHTEGFLRGGGVVEIDKRTVVYGARQYWEVLANFIDIVHVVK